MKSYLAFGEDSLTLRLVSKLPDLRVANAKWIRTTSCPSRIKWGSINMMHAVASYLWRDIEVVITGLTRKRLGFITKCSSKLLANPCLQEFEVQIFGTAVHSILSKFQQLNTERYRSGHNGADSKSVCAQAHEGSNPSLSAKARRDAKRRSVFALREYKQGFERSEQNNLNGCFGTVTEDFCETLHKIKSKTLSKNQERIPLCYILKKDCGFHYFVI